MPLRSTAAQPLPNSSFYGLALCRLLDIKSSPFISIKKSGCWYYIAVLNKKKRECKNNKHCNSLLRTRYKLMDKLLASEVFLYAPLVTLPFFYVYLSFLLLFFCKSAYLRNQAPVLAVVWIDRCQIPLAFSPSSLNPGARTYVNVGFCFSPFGFGYTAAALLDVMSSLNI